MALPADESQTSKRPYRRLRGRGRRTSGCVAVGAPIHTIWLADDHLLLRESVYGMSESYKRFYFRDVQAIIVRRSPRWIAWIAIWMFLCLVFIFCYGVAHKQGWGWPFLSGLCFLLAVVQLARGPTCVTHLVTAVQRELLGSLNTVRKARRALKTLVPLIEQKQGTLDPESLQNPGTSPGPPGRTVGQTVQSRAGAVTHPPVIAPQLSRLSLPHLLLFVATLAGGAVAFWEYFRPSPPSLIAGGILLGAILVLSVVALVAQGRQRVNKAISALTWTVTISYIVAWIIIYTVYSSIHTFQGAQERAAKHEPPQLITDLSPAALRQMPGFDYVLLVYGACSVGLGAAGLGILLLRRARLPEPPPLPPPATPI
jgi:hypothetical protein